MAGEFSIIDSRTYEEANIFNNALPSTALRYGRPNVIVNPVRNDLTAQAKLLNNQFSLARSQFSSPATRKRLAELQRVVNRREELENNIVTNVLRGDPEARIKMIDAYAPREDSILDIPKNLFSEGSDMILGLGALTALGFRKALGAVEMGFTDPTEFMDVLTSRETYEDLWEGTKDIGGALVDDYKQYFVDPRTGEASFEQFKRRVTRRPLSALLDLSTILTLGGTGAIKAAQLTGKVGQIGKLGRAASAVERLAKAAQTMGLATDATRGVTTAGRFALNYGGKKFTEFGIKVGSKIPALNPIIGESAVLSRKVAKTIREKASEVGVEFNKSFLKEIQELDEFAILKPDQAGRVTDSLLVGNPLDLTDIERTAYNSTVDFLVQREKRLFETGTLTLEQMNNRKMKQVAIKEGLLESGQELTEEAAKVVEELRRTGLEPLADQLNLLKPGKGMTNEVFDQLYAKYGEQINPQYLHLVPDWKALNKADKRILSKRAPTNLSDPDFMKKFTGTLLHYNAYNKDIYKTMIRMKAQMKTLNGTYETIDRTIRQLVDDKIAKRVTTITDVPEGWMVVNAQSLKRGNAVSIEALEDITNQLRKGADSGDVFTSMNVKLDKADDALRKMSTDDITNFMSDTYAVPPEVAQAFDKVQMASNRVLNGGTFRMFWDSGLSAWKAAVLSLTGRWHLNNVAGNTMINMIAGVGPISYMYALPSSVSRIAQSFPKLDKVMRTLLGDKAYERVLKNGTKFRDITGDMLASQGFLGEFKGPLTSFRDASPVFQAMEDNFLYKLFRPVGGKIKAISDASFEMGAHADSWFREANAIHQLRKMKGFKQARVKSQMQRFVKPYESMLNALETMEPGALKIAGNEAERWISSYQKLLSPFEKRYMRRIIPFYSWFKHISLVSARLPIDFPARTRMLQFIGQVGGDMADDEWAMLGVDRRALPAYMQATVPIGQIDESGNVMSIRGSAAVPFNTVREYSLSALAPPIRMLIENMQGRDVFTQKPFRAGKPDPFTYQDPISGNRFEWDGVRSKKIGPVRPFLEAPLFTVFQEFPQFQLARRLLYPFSEGDKATFFRPDPIVDKKTGLPMYPKNRLNEMLKLLGLSMSPVNLEKISKRMEKERRQAINSTFNTLVSDAEPSIKARMINSILTEDQRLREERRR